VEEYDRAGQTTDDNVKHAHCMLDTNATNTLSGYVTIIAFPLQQCLQECVSVLRYTHIACVVYYCLRSYPYLVRIFRLEWRNEQTMKEMVQ